MRRLKSPLILVGSLFEETPDLSYLRDLPVRKLKKIQQDEGDEENPPPVPSASLDQKTPALQPRAKRIEKGLSAGPLRPLPGREDFRHHETGQPSLAQLTRPDLSHGHERMQRHVERYNDHKSHAHTVRSYGHSANPVFHSQQANGHETILKPVGTMEPTHDPEHVGPRNQHMYDMLSAMGAHHMGVPNFVGTFHPHEKMGRRVIHPEENDSPEKRRRMARSHAGMSAHVVEYSPGKRIGDADPAEISQVDHRHRLVGAIAHLISSNSDGHSGNIMLTKGPNGKLHPVLYDADISGESTAQKYWRAMHGRETVRSHFLPGGDLAYNANGEEIGTNYPHEIAATLREYARGEHFGRHGINKEDAELFQRNAQELLDKGLENTIANRKLLDPHNAGHNTAPVPTVKVPR